MAWAHATHIGSTETRLKATAVGGLLFGPPYMPQTVWLRVSKLYHFRHENVNLKINRGRVFLNHVFKCLLCFYYVLWFSIFLCCAFRYKTVLLPSYFSFVSILFQLWGYYKTLQAKLRTFAWLRKTPAEIVIARNLFAGKTVTESEPR